MSLHPSFKIEYNVLSVIAQELAACHVSYIVYEFVENGLGLRQGTTV